MTQASINKEELSSIKKDGMMITVGLDFGTHQTKLCIESKGGVELSYSFVKFTDIFGKSSFTLPSIVGIGNDNKLTYGFLSPNFNGNIVRYFKQASFRQSIPEKGLFQETAMYYSVWYIAFILFDLEEVFGQSFSIQMGAPTDSSHINVVKKTATRIVASAYKLVEDVFKTDKQKFLDTEITKLKQLTELVEYSDAIKDEYQLLVFPEAYACLKPLVSDHKISTGMSLMIDIGGGTTDISFFTIENNIPQVYDFFSIGKGLNYLTCAEEKKSKSLDSNVKSVTEIDMDRKEAFSEEIKRICNTIRNKLVKEFRMHTSLKLDKLYDALKNRPVVYCGGGSTFGILRNRYAGYCEIKHVSGRDWNTKAIKQIEEIVSKKLCPILSTSYGLAISTENDNIQVKSLEQIFKHLHVWNEDKKEHSNKYILGSDYGGFSYADDYDAWK